MRAALDIRKEGIKVIFAGSSEATLRHMFGVASEPFYKIIADGKKDLYGQIALKKLGESLGLEGNVNSTTIQNSLRRLEKKI